MLVVLAVTMEQTVLRRSLWAIKNITTQQHVYFDALSIHTRHTSATCRTENFTSLGDNKPLLAAATARNEPLHALDTQPSA